MSGFGRELKRKWGAWVVMALGLVVLPLSIGAVQVRQTMQSQASQASQALWLEPAKVVTRPGEVFEVRINGFAEFEAISELTAVLKFDEKRLSLVGTRSGVVGERLRAWEQPGGKLLITGKPQFLGSGTLLTVKLRSLVMGESQVALDKERSGVRFADGGFGVMAETPIVVMSK